MSVMDITVSHRIHLILVCFYFRKILNHRKPKAYLLSLDTEIEITLQNLRKIIVTESKSMANQRERLQAIPEEEEEEAERTQRPNTMEDFLRPIIQEEYFAVRKPAIEANNFELKPALITMVQ